ncbi:phosphoglycerate kinase [Salinimicrobium sp. MT39]|uniref:Phosphoglycerate kinase n=1 Tax=Salinimicrobium profundisediminis TaxID=2994553 RepID=A0A9X3CX62_9FLAO|nr:phosphoglycerate kinase [Salinimicrobium profundisediminis]MCX2838501.1 phosphoglycerate kinase [Salinimicrobium profundisediminis]
MKTINDYNFKDKKALIRVDFNVPLNEQQEVGDTSRIEGAKPTIDKILKDGGSAILMSHLGRPKGVDKKNSLQHIVKKVSEILGVEVKFVDECVGEKAQQAAKDLKPGEVLLLENLRFHAEEEKGDEEFSRKLSTLGDIYVNDAFGTAHRAHASTTIVANYFEDKCVGALLGKEIDSLEKVLGSSEKPVTAVLGGAKVSTKITVIENILDKIDHLIIGGGMTYTFTKAKGGTIGDSLVENDKLELALEILRKAEEKGVKIHLPVDAVIADSFSEEADTKIVSVDEIPEGWMGLDIGPDTVKKYGQILEESKTILWNGPMGVFEMQAFAKGTIAVGEHIAAATKKGAFSLVGGGDSVAAVKQFGLEDQVSYVSTGGGAMLEMLEGKSLPGIEALKK